MAMFPRWFIMFLAIVTGCVTARHYPEVACRENPPPTPRSMTLPVAHDLVSLRPDCVTTRPQVGQGQHITSVTLRTMRYSQYAFRVVVSPSDDPMSRAVCYQRLEGDGEVIVYFVTPLRPQELALHVIFEEPGGTLRFTYSDVQQLPRIVTIDDQRVATSLSCTADVDDLVSCVHRLGTTNN